MNALCVASLYSAADTFFGWSDWWCPTEDMLRMCLCLQDKLLLASYIFKVIDLQSTQKVTKGAENHFLQKCDSLTAENFQNCATKGFTGFTYSCQVSRNRWSGTDQTGACSIHPGKGWYFAPFSVASQKILQGQSFPVLHLSANFCPNLFSFRGDIISENVFQTHYNIGVKPVRFSPTTRNSYTVERIVLTWKCLDNCHFTR